MKEITINIDGKEIKAMVSKEELEKLTRKEEKEWPQEGEPYWWVSGAGMPRPYNFYNDSSDRLLMSIGNFYRSEQEALDAIRAQKLIAAVARRRKELNGDWKPVDYEGDYISFNSAYLNVTGTPFGIYKDSECVRTIIEEFKDDLLWFFTEYVVSVN